MSSGTFSILEDVKVELNGTQIALIRSQEPNHKIGITPQFREFWK